MDWMAESDLKGKREVVAVVQFIVYRRIYLKGHSINHKILTTVSVTTPFRTSALRMHVKV